MDAHLRLNLKSGRKNREALDKFIVKCARACHDILDIALENQVDKPTHQTISRIVERTFIFGKIRRRKAVADDHIRFSL